MIRRGEHLDLFKVHTISIKASKFKGFQPIGGLPARNSALALTVEFSVFSGAFSKALYR